MTCELLDELDEPTDRSLELLLLPPPDPELDAVDRGAAVSPVLVELDEPDAVRCAAARAGTASANATANETTLRGDVAMVSSRAPLSGPSPAKYAATLLPRKAPVNS